MIQEYIKIIMAGIIFFFCLTCISIIVYFYKREKRLFHSLQKMLDDAIAGKFEDKRLDETKISAIENSMWRYLCGNKLLYEKVKEQKEQLQTLISDISHQAVTPVSNLILYSQLLEEWQIEIKEKNMQEIEPLVKEMGLAIEKIELPIEEIEAIKEQAKKVDFFIQSLIKLSRLETGIIAVNAVYQNIDKVLLSIKQQFFPKAKQKGILFEVESVEAFAVFDQKWTIEAIGNIVDNAIKYTKNGGKVSVKIEKYTIFLRIDIIDTGIGIRESEQGDIFTRFYRSASVSEKSGLGLGLYLAREIIKAQNGYIKVTSEFEKGSKFSVFLLRKRTGNKK